jgi:threonine dehydrogenase-like Zn-dependent dehydrogenase
MKVDTAEDIQAKYYCTRCDEIVEIPHRKDEHDGDISIDLLQVTVEGRDLVAIEDNMGHYSPHMWTDVDGHEMCVECGAVLLEKGWDA